MEPASALARKMLKVEKFIQRDPKDGAPVSQQTEAYLGYTDKNLYIVFLAFDNNPKLMRARMLRRELIDDDDQCGFFLDTFHDRRHAYAFYANPYGIQQDGCTLRPRGQTRALTRSGIRSIRSLPMDIFWDLRFHSSHCGSSLHQLTHSE